MVKVMREGRDREGERRKGEKWFEGEVYVAEGKGIEGRMERRKVNLLLVIICGGDAGGGNGAIVINSH